MEFRTAAMMACNNVEPQEVYDIERQLLYAACLCARDHLRATSVEPARRSSVI
jgi:hypothetical protein